MYQSLTKSLQQNAKVAVIGSGISGLSFAYFLSKLRPDVNITLYDHSDRPGGYINTDYKDGLKYEKGPRTLRGVSDGTLVILDTMLKLGYKEDIYAIYKKSQGNKKYLLSNQKNSEDDYMVQVPDSGETMTKFMMSPLSKGVLKSLIMEPFRPIKKTDDDESIGTFIRRRFDKKLNDNVVSAMIHGIYGGDSSKLSIKALMPRLYQLEKKSSLVVSMIKSVYQDKDADKDRQVDISDDLLSYEKNFGKPMIPFENFKKYLKNFPMILFKDKGLSLLPNAIYKELQKNNKVKFIFNSEVNISQDSEGEILINDTKYDHVRSTISAKNLAQTIQPGQFQLKLNELKFVDMIVVNIFVKNTRLYKEGFGYLVPQSVSPFKHYLLGCIFDSSIEKNSIKLLENNRYLVKLINYPKIKQQEINSMIKLKDTSDDEKLVKLTMMFGGHYIDRYPDLLKQSDRQWRKTVENLVEEQFNLTTEDIVVNRIPQCIPQYQVGYLEYKDQVMTELAKEYGDKLSMGGMSFNSLNGVGVPDCVLDGMKLAIDLK